jgi:hypothetical protein
LAAANLMRPQPLNAKLDREQFLKEFARLGARRMSEQYGMTERNVYERRRRLERISGVVMTPPMRGGHVQQLDKHPAAVKIDIQDGHILVGSDSHYWPGIVSTAHRAFLEFAKEYKPKIIIKNGDEADFPQISRHAPIAWEERPKLSVEIDNLKAMLSEIEKVSPKSRRVWPLGNHDARFETRLATVAPEYANVHGVHLKDNFQAWEPCWAAFVNKDTVIKHRWKGGTHATHNNTLKRWSDDGYGASPRSPGQTSFRLQRNQVGSRYRNDGRSLRSSVRQLHRVIPS